MTRKITDLPLITIPVAGDMLEIVDVSDLSESSQGSSKRIDIASLNPGPQGPQGSGQATNLIINGNFDVWQRGDLINGTGGWDYTADRWSIRRSGGQGGSRVTKDTTTDPGKIWGVLQRVAGNTEIGLIHINQIFESKNIVEMQSKVCTLSFDIIPGANLSSTDNDVKINFYTTTENTDGGDVTRNSGGSFNTGAGAALQQTISVMTPTTIALTFTMPSDTETFSFNVGWIPIGTAGADDGIRIRRVQLEAGDTATEFELQTPAQVLADCQRYYQSIINNISLHGIAYGQAYSATLAAQHLPLKANLRVYPTLILSAPGHFALGGNTGADQVCLTIALDGTSNPELVSILATSAGGLAAGDACGIRSINTIAVLALDAEL